MQPRLSEGQLRILQQLTKKSPLQVSELAHATNLETSTTSREVSTLSSLGLVRHERRGLGKFISLSDTKHASILRNLMVHRPYLRYGELLSGKSLDLLSGVHLVDLTTIDEIQEYSGVSHVTVIRLLARYKELGAVRKARGTYRLGTQYEPFGEFLREFRSYTNLQTLRSKAPDATVVWERNRDFLCRSPHPVENGYSRSAFSAFPGFGVDLFLPRGDYYFYSPRRVRIGPEEAAIHALLMAESSRDWTMISLLVLKANLDEARVLKLARIYRSVETAQALFSFIKTRGKDRRPGLPTWHELASRMRQYR